MKALKLSAIALATLLALPVAANDADKTKNTKAGDKPAKTAKVETKKEAKSDYKVKLYNVPYNVLGINSKDPRYNQKAKMYFALEEKGYYPLMNMLISSENRNPFTATQIIAGYAYVNHWDLEVKNNIALLNKSVGLNILPENATLDEKIAAKLALDDENLTGLYLTTKMLNDWQTQKPKEGYERVQSELNELNKFFSYQVDKKVKSDAEYTENAVKLYQTGLKALKGDLTGNIDVQFYLQSLIYRDELLRQITEVALLNSLNPDELGVVNFAADALLKEAEKAKMVLILNPYYQQSNERNKDIRFEDVSFVGKYDRVYQDGEDFGEMFGINHAIEILPTQRNVKGLDLKLFNNNDSLRYTVTYNPNGRGLDFFGETDYYLELTKDKQFLVMYINPSEGDALKYIFKRTNNVTPFAFDTKNTPIKELFATVEQGNLRGNIDAATAGKPTTVIRAWHNIVGNDFYISEDQAANAGYNWNKYRTYGIMPTTSQCGTESAYNDDCVHRIETTSVFISGSDIGIDTTNQCSDYTKSRMGAASIKLSRNVKGVVYTSYEQDQSLNSENYIAFSVPVKSGDKTEELCVLNHFKSGENHTSDAVKLSNGIINYLNRGE